MSLSAVELWNQTGFLALNAGAQAPAFLIMAARLIAGWSVLLVMVLLIATWVRRTRDTRFALLDATGAALLGLGIAQVITRLWYHPRPFEMGLGRQLLDHAAEASFPSDHATLLFSLALPLICQRCTRRLGIAFLIMGFAVAWSRIYLGVHFPLDMIGAMVVAGLATHLIRMIAQHLRPLFYPRLISTYEHVLRHLRLPAAVFPRNL